MLVLLGEIEYQGPLPRHAQEMDSNKVMEYPARRGGLSPLSFVVRERGCMLLERLTDAVLQGGIHQQTDRHHHEQGHNACGLFEIERRSEQVWIFQKPKTAFRLHLTFIAGSQLPSRPEGVIEFIGGQDETTMVLNEHLTSR